MAKTSTMKKMAYRYWRKPTTKGYNRKGYNFNKSVKGYKKSGYFKTVKSGSGHDAGFRWAEQKGIDPESKIRRYSKNSPSFDEGVYRYKDTQRSKKKMADMVRNTKTLSFSKQASNPPKKEVAMV
jgi:lipopolysaccharide export LptBFGC system permease protein LptF